jgi:Polysaccharide pyruvyl transferase
VSEKLFGKSSTKVLVHGWYDQNNLGDDCFIDAFKFLFPNFNFTFTNYITNNQLQDIDAVFLGGGSFLGEPLSIEASAFSELKKCKIFYLGVGTETDIHSNHKELLNLAQLIAIRTPDYLDKMLAINNNVIVIPDLVYCLTPQKADYKIVKSVLIIPNIAVVPAWNDPHWKHAAWEYFKNEFAQFVEELFISGYTVKFLPMCVNNSHDDGAAAYEIVNRMSRRRKHFFLEKSDDFYSATYLISQYSAVITQRYHGIILSDLAQVPHMSIYHHDKLKNASKINLSYYGISKGILWENFNKINLMKDTSILPIDRDIFKVLIQKVEYALCSDQK